ncbi:MAG: hypothetical protein IMZ53_06250 [Thermoplasmata archaeon]|nr:hypothetical protein [Thermoplasmata archaeon]
MKTINKTLAVANHLCRYKSITSWGAICTFKATRLSSIIFNLKKKGMKIITTYPKKEHYAIYRLIRR